VYTHNTQAEIDREREAYLAAQAPAAAAPVAAAAAAAAVFTHTVTGVAAGVRSASKLSPTGQRGRGRYLQHVYYSVVFLQMYAIAATAVRAVICEMDACLVHRRAVQLCQRSRAFATYNAQLTVRRTALLL
jgi:hypothetical protein